MTTTTTVEMDDKEMAPSGILLGIGSFVEMILFKLAGNHNETLVSDEAELQS